jgi:hypothetical protein
LLKAVGGVDGQSIIRRWTSDGFQTYQYLSWFFSIVILNLYSGYCKKVTPLHVIVTDPCKFLSPSGGKFLEDVREYEFVFWCLRVLATLTNSSDGIIGSFSIFVRELPIAVTICHKVFIVLWSRWQRIFLYLFAKDRYLCRN